LGQGISLIDTPGVRHFALKGIEPRDVAAWFPEMRERATGCAFGASCGHRAEAGCAVREAVEAGEMHPDRYESYLRIRADLEEGRQ
jgi:ribosome biogenesis GTPase